MAELPLGALADVDIEPRRIAPQVERRVGAHHLVAGEIVLGAIARPERELVLEALRLDRVLVDAHQVELAVEYLQRIGRQRRAFHGADDASRVLGVGDEAVDVVDDHRDGEAAGMAFLLAAPSCRLVGQRDRRRDEASHALGELDARRTDGLAPLRRGDQHRRVEALLLGELPVAIGGEMDHRPLGDGADGQQRIDAQRPRDHRAVADIKTVEDRTFCRVGARVENLALVIDDAALGIAAHDAAAQRMHGDEIVAEDGLGERVARVVAARRLRRLAQVAVDFGEDRLVSDLRPDHAHPVFVVELDAALAVVVAHDEIGLGAVERALIGTEQEALAAPCPLTDEVEDTAVGIVAELVGADGEERGQDRRQ